MATGIQQLMDSLFFRRLVAERGLTSPEDVASLAGQVMARPDLDIEGAFSRGDVTPTMDPTEFLRAVQRPIQGDGGQPAANREERSPSPGQVAATQAAEQARADQRAAQAIDLENTQAVSDWAAAVQAGEFEKADKALADLSAARGATDVSAPTIQSITQIAADSVTAGTPLSLDDVTKAATDKLTGFFDDLTAKSPGITQAQKTAMQFGLGLVPGVGPALSLLAGAVIDRTNLEKQNELRAALGLEPAELGFLSTLGRNLPFGFLFTNPITPDVFNDLRSNFLDSPTTVYDPELTDALMSFTGHTPGFNISRGVAYDAMDPTTFGYFESGGGLGGGGSAVTSEAGPVSSEAGIVTQGDSSREASGGNPGASGNCYITTAALTATGEADDGRTLSALRRFRDDHVPPALVAIYYRTAPEIVAAINSRTDAPAIYRRLYDRYIRPAVAAIEAGRFGRTLALYLALVGEAQAWSRK